MTGALPAASLLLTKFSWWDDEGYMLLSLSHYVSEGGLYTQTFSQYGPFYFYAQGVFFQLFQLPVTHEMGRLVTLFYWVTSSVLAAVFVYRLSRSIYLACSAGLSVMIAGVVLTNEPGHPQQVVLLLNMIAACLAIPSTTGRYNLRFFLLGCVGAALMFTKINMGAFYIAGLAHAIVCLLSPGKVRQIGIVLTLLYAAGIPWLLMHGSLHLGFRGYLLLATIGGIVTFAYGALIRPSRYLPVRTAVVCAAGAVAGTLLVIAATSLQGMSLSTLLSGVILRPLNHPNVFHIPLYLDRRMLLGALTLFLGIAALALVCTPCKGAPVD